MKISRLYSNQSTLFDPIEFSHGLNVVLAEIRLPNNQKKHTHNLGKTTLGKLLDFVFLSKREADFFLFKDIEIFKHFIFYVEIELFDSTFLTVRRSVIEASKISFKKHESQYRDFSSLPSNEWDHEDIPFDRAREMLDSLLDWSALKPWSYRKILGYLLRTQDDFGDIFQLHKFGPRHEHWKPFLAHMMGFDDKIVEDHYKKKTVINNKNAAIETITNELNGSIDDIGKIDGILLLKSNEAEKLQNQLDSFDFRSEDKKTIKQLIENIDIEISQLNSKKYYLDLSKKRIRNSLKNEQLLFDPEQAKKIFFEAGIFFDGQIKKSFEQLISFNKAITNERNQYLQEELDEITAELKIINGTLNKLGRDRSEKLSYLSFTDSFEKYKKFSDHIVTLKADINELKRRRISLERLMNMRVEVRNLISEYESLQVQIENNLKEQSSNSDSLFSKLRLFFSEIVEKIINRKALISVSTNKDGHMDFKVRILDESGNDTSADHGNSYKKLLCIAFDLAILRTHLDQKFPRFVYHDGVFESMDDRIKENLLEIYREYSSMGIQPIITLIDSDLPKAVDNAYSFFTEDELTLILHDENKEGRLFKMDAW